jgi:hypothetical protein
MGSRFGRLARTRSSTRALDAQHMAVHEQQGTQGWFCVDAATLFRIASDVRNPRSHELHLEETAVEIGPGRWPRQREGGIEVQGESRFCGRAAVERIEEHVRFAEPERSRHSQIAAGPRQDPFHTRIHTIHSQGLFRHADLPIAAVPRGRIAHCTTAERAGRGGGEEFIARGRDTRPDRRRQLGWPRPAPRLPHEFAGSPRQ